jgi:alanyl-tRNA synthetase
LYFIMIKLTGNELRQKYLEFFKSKHHAIIPSASLIPENDPTTLFTGSGMQPMVHYLLGEKHPLGKRITDSQKCFRTQDIEEVGDNRHTTVFEMLGNWSLGDYFKKEQIAWMFEFLTKEIGLDPRNLYITVFRGNDKLGILRDIETAEYWKKEFSSAGIIAKDIDFSEEKGMQGGRIFYYDEKKNWWSRAGVPANMPIGEPGGPDSEMFWDFGADLKLHENSSFKDKPCHVNCDCGRFIEIGNNVFMQYVKTKKGFELLKQGNIDFGGGLERMAAASINNPDIFCTDLFFGITKKIEELSGTNYNESNDVKRSFRVIADHIKAGVFLISDGILPSNTERGYFLRRIIRRAVRYGRLIEIRKEFTVSVAESVIKIYEGFFPDLVKNKALIFNELKKEEEKFSKTLENGLREFEKLAAKNEVISAKDAFLLFQSYGFPIEITQELAREKNVNVDAKGFQKEFELHQELSRVGAEKKFKGGLSDSKEETKKLHTATHILGEALRKILGNRDIKQKGSNINAERLRYDFNFDRKLTDDELKEVEEEVNRVIGLNLEVKREEMDTKSALKIAIGEFGARYPSKVSVYSCGDYSKEICMGPHAENTKELGHFKIQKEESVAAGIRRIKATLEN